MDDPVRSSHSVLTLRAAGFTLLVLAAIANPWVLGLWPGGSLLLTLLMGGLEGLLGLVALVLLLRPGWVRRHRYQLWLLLGMAVLGMGILELGLRLNQWFFARPLPIRTSEHLGWITRAGIERTRRIPGFGTIHYSTGPYGFRRFDDPDAEGFKLMVLGDSYTQAATVSDGQAYYDHLARRRPGMHVFAMGVGGYGTLQEYMILDRHAERIRPDLILIQLCSNDLINNLPRLEAASLFNNNHQRRPYLIDGRIQWLHPDHGCPALTRIIGASRLLSLLDRRLTLWSSERARRWPEQSIEADLGPNHPLYRQAARVTLDILRKIAQRAGTTPVAAFCVDRPPWLEGDLFATLCDHAGIQFIPGVPDVLAAARSDGRRVDGAPHDDHWNAAGHRLAARQIERHLVEAGRLPGPAACPSQPAAGPVSSS